MEIDCDQKKDSKSFTEREEGYGKEKERKRNCDSKIDKQKVRETVRVQERGRYLRKNIFAYKYTNRERQRQKERKRERKKERNRRRKIREFECEREIFFPIYIEYV